MVQRERTMRTPTEQDAIDLVHWVLGGKSFVRVARIEIFDAGAMIQTLKTAQVFGGVYLDPMNRALELRDLEVVKRVMVIVIYTSGPRSWFEWSRMRMQRELVARFKQAAAITDRESFSPLVRRA